LDVPQAHAPDKLGQRDELFTRIFLDSPIAIVLFDAEGRIIALNKACLDMIGLPDAVDFRLWPSLFKDPAVPHEARKALREHQVIRYKWSVDYDNLRTLGVYSGTRSGICYIDVLTCPLGLDPSGSIAGYMSQIQDVTELRLAERKLSRYQRQLQILASQLSLAEEQERRRLASGLHDQVGQTMALMKFKLGAAKDLPCQADVHTYLDEIGTLLDDAIRQTRSLTFDLSPPILYELGLEPALEWIVEQFHIHYGLRCELKDDGQPKPLGDDLRGLLFSAVRELLVNITKHAHARTVTVSVRREGNSISINIEDDGVGFDVSGAGWRKQGFGLFNVRERLTAVGGHFEVKSELGRGTMASLAAPLSIDEKEAEGEPS